MRQHFASRGVFEEAKDPQNTNQHNLWRGAFEATGGKGVAIAVGDGRRGGHAVESHISGFAGFNIQRPKDRPAPAKKPV